MKLLLCKLNRHSFTNISTENIHIKQFECSNCKKKFTTDGYGRMVELNSYWKKNNQFFEHYFQKTKLGA